MIANMIKNQTNIAQNQSDEEETLALMNTKNFMLTEKSPVEENYNYQVYFTSLAANETACIYDWLADSGLINHTVNWCKLFSSYKHTLEATVYGVDGKITSVARCGTVILTAQYGMWKRILCLKNVNHIISNKYNIFALGRWKGHRWSYHASIEEVTLYNTCNKPILKVIK